LAFTLLSYQSSMKKKSICLMTMALACLLSPQYSFAQRNCGEGYVFRHLSIEDPAKMQELRNQHNQLTAQAIANEQHFANAKTAASAPVPVVFHIVVSTANYYKLGADTGIKRRVNSQLAALNRDFNGQNPDKSKIPTPFKSLFANVGVSFGLAKLTTSNTIAPGIEVRILDNAPNYDVNNACAAVKVASTGLLPWDNAKYLNIWVTNIYGGSSGGAILGVTVPPSLENQNVMGHTYTNSEKGIVLSYGAFGTREFSSQYFIQGIDQGRTLTHETGHYFELWHTWGDDGGLCPGTGGGWDDNIADTPPQADATYCNSGTCPTFPKYDACSPASSSNGIMFMNYMDYTDDAAMYMFTLNQASVMKQQLSIGYPSYTLTQNPGLSTVGVGNVANAAPLAWTVAPNPTTGAFQLTLDRTEGFRGATVLNMMGQTIANINAAPGQKQFNFDLSNAPRGMYLVQCHYEGGTETKKLVLE
jgi:hypothetical protein